MRFPRIKANGQGFYHCVSRVVEGRFIFGTSGHGSAEAERFITLMRSLEAFCDIQVLTYVLMSNHFHLLCEVPEPRALSEAEVLERIEAGYGPSVMTVTGYSGTRQTKHMRPSSGITNQHVQSCHAKNYIGARKSRSKQS